MPIIHEDLIMMFHNVGFEISRLFSEYGKVKVKGGE